MRLFNTSALPSFTWAGKPIASDFGTGSVYFTDTEELAYSNGNKYISTKKKEVESNKHILFSYNKATNSALETGGPFYDAFGLLIKSDSGDVFNFFRRGDVHYSGAYGKVMLTKLDASSSTCWTTPVEFYSDPLVDTRFTGGGVANDGSLVLFLGFANLDGVSVSNSYKIARSLDNGQTWNFTGPFSDTSLAADQSMCIYGNCITAGNGRMIQPYYVHKPSNSHKMLKTLVSEDNGATWSVGATVAGDTAVMLSEMTLGYCGSGFILALARTVASGNGQFNIYKSTDNGGTWAAASPASTSFETGFLKSPLLVPFKSAGGNSMLALFYNDNTAGALRRRNINCYTAALNSGSYPIASAFRPSRYINSSINIGYPRAARIGGQTLVVSDHETSSTNCNFKTNVDTNGDEPEIDTGYFAVAANTLYNKPGINNTALGGVPSRFTLTWCATLPQSDLVAEYDATRSCVVVLQGTNGTVDIQTGTYTFDGTGYGSMPAAQTAGYYRLRCWQ